MTETQVILGAVAQVLDPYTVVLNKGHRDGVERGMRFAVYYISKEEIQDPETGETLGKVELFKGYGKIFSVQEKLSVLKSDRYSNSFFAALTTFKTGEGPTRLPFDSPTVGDIVKSELGSG